MAHYNKKERKEKLKEIKAGEHSGTYELYLDDRLKEHKVFKVDVDYLIYNPKNGRIGTDVDTYEIQHGELDQDANEGDMEIIAGFIRDASPKDNQEVIDSLKKYGQQTPAVVTADGVVVGGNRRLYCLREAKLQYIKAVILDVEAADDVKSLMKLEMVLQNAIPQQQDYRANEKYLQIWKVVTNWGGKEVNGEWDPDSIPLDAIDELIPQYKRNHANKKTRLNEILKDLKIKKRQDEYLEKMKAPKIYRGLRNKEDYLIGISSSLSSYKPNSDSYADRVLTKREISDFTAVSYALTKAQFQGTGKDYRALTTRNNEGKGNFFGTKEAWEIVYKGYKEEIEPLINNLTSFDDLRKTTDNPEEEYEREEEKYQADSKGIWTGIFNRAQRVIDDGQLENKAEEMIKRAHSSLEKIEKENLEWPPKTTNMDADKFKEMCNELRKMADTLNRKVN